MGVHLFRLNTFEGGNMLPNNLAVRFHEYQCHALGMAHDTYGVYQTIWC